VRILFLDQFADLGGAQHALLDTVDAVLKAGWEARVLLPGPGPLMDALRARRVPTNEIPCGPYRSGSKPASDFVRFALDLRRQVRIIDELLDGIGLVYVNGPRLLPAAALAARSRAPVVFHLHSHLRGSALRLARWSMWRARATVVGCSNSVLDPLRPHLAESSFYVIPNGVRDQGFRTRAFEEGRPLRIGMIGRIAPEKGQLEFVAAAALLRDQFPRARFVICGAPLFSANGSYFESVRARATNLPVEFVAWQSSVSEVLRDLDLLVVPSRQEGMGRVVLEAFSAGVPVIAFPAGGIPEAVIDRVTGFLTQDFTPAALALSIHDAIGAGPETLRRIASNARETWARRYTLPAYRERIRNLIESLQPDSRPARETEMPLPRR